MDTQSKPGVDPLPELSLNGDTCAESKATFPRPIPFKANSCQSHPDVSDARSEDNFDKQLFYDLSIFDDVDNKMKENLDNELVKTALDQGIDMRDYVADVEAELKRVEDFALNDYIAEAANIASLHYQIKSCDSALGLIEDMLSSFKTNLGNISTEIRWLQQQSANMSVKLKNRQAVRSELSQYINELAVPESMIRCIVESAVTDQVFVEQLHELNHKIGFAKQQAFQDARSAQDVRDVLLKLRVKATAKIRDYLLQKIQQFKKPMTNYQMAQNAMLKFRFFYEFLLNTEREIAREVKDSYLETTSKIFYSYFKHYWSRLIKLQLEDLPTKDDLVGVDESAKRGFFSTVQPKLRAPVFSLGERATILLAVNLEAAVIVPHTSSQSNQRYPFEVLFRSMHWALVDNASREYLFIIDFFMLGGQAAQNLFNEIWGKTMLVLLKYLEEFVTTSFDSVGLYLCLQITQKYRETLDKRGVTALEPYFEAVQQILLPRLEFVLDLNVQSLRAADPSAFKITSQPHYITRRYAELLAAVLVLKHQGQDYPRLTALVKQLQLEMDSLIMRMAAEFSDRKFQLIFMLNNYDTIWTVVQEHTQEDSREIEGLRGILAQRVNDFVEQLLWPYFGPMIEFIKQSEAAMERNLADTIKADEKKIGSIVRSFNTNWKKGMDEINAEVMRTFSNFKQGTSILQTALTHLVQYYHRLHKILSLPQFKNFSVRGELINLHHLMVEVKKYKTSF